MARATPVTTAGSAPGDDEGRGTGRVAGAPPIVTAQAQLQPLVEPQPSQM